MNHFNLAYISQSFYCTLTEINSNTSGSILELVNQSDNRNYNVFLPLDSSLYPNRYNRFDIPTTSLSQLTEGIYKFTAKDSSGNITETGLIKIVSESISSSIADTYLFITGSIESDDYITYQ